MYKRTVIFFLCFIILFGLFLRVYKIDSIPPHPSLDEATIGYNAYSILHTGKDEFGNRWPILLRAYDDYRPALYVYLVIPFVWMLDLTVAAVRMPSVILSTVSLLFFYIASRRIFKEVGACGVKGTGSSSDVGRFMTSGLLAALSSSIFIFGLTLLFRFIGVTA
jgi:4-amino-4-deoxy-L-arabinose transferase-like glycosyltransferase